MRAEIEYLCIPRCAGHLLLISPAIGDSDSELLYPPYKCTHFCFRQLTWNEGSTSYFFSQGKNSQGPSKPVSLSYFSSHLYLFHSGQIVEDQTPFLFPFFSFRFFVFVALIFQVSIAAQKFFRGKQGRLKARRELLHKCAAIEVRCVALGVCSLRYDKRRYTYFSKNRAKRFGVITARLRAFFRCANNNLRRGGYSYVKIDDETFWCKNYPTTRLESVSVALFYGGP